MKVFAYAQPPLNGRYLIGYADIPDEAEGLLTLAPMWLAKGIVVTPLTLDEEGSVRTELVVLLNDGQAPEKLPGWTPARSR